MAEPAWYFLASLKDEGVGAWRCRFQQAELPIVDSSVVGQFAQVAAKQRQVMFVVDAAYAAQAVGSRLVVDMADQRIT